MNKTIMLLPGIGFLAMVGYSSGECGGPEELKAKTAGDLIVPENSGEKMSDKNYQDEILSNPRTSGEARAKSTESGGNTAIIIQNGSRNKSSVKQAGDNNTAEHTQNGMENELQLEQTGKNNRSQETQTGKHNRKVIRQHDSETVIEQVNP
ncbi:MAG: hypothetical protein LWW75_01650 [Chlorobiales bacterium]|nr:hypothetical protein [Chlorobiales bacterium]